MPKWVDKKGRTCEYYNINPKLCSKAQKNLSGVSSVDACCSCKNNIRMRVRSEATGDSEPQMYVPCPEEQLWGDLDESGYTSVGVAECPAGLDCVRHTFSWVNGMQQNVLRGPATQSCWKMSESGYQSPDQYTCKDDNFCRNLDVFNSEPGNLIYECPNATCGEGSCNCGSECMKDPRTSVCIPSSTTTAPVITQPPVGKCTLAQLSKDDYACWKVTEEGFITNCEPELCGLNDSDYKVMGTRKLAGTSVTVYTKVDSVDSDAVDSDAVDSDAVDSDAVDKVDIPTLVNGLPNKLHPMYTTIFACYIVVILLGCALAIWVVYKLFYSKPKRRRRRSRFG